jgi:small subunit ribosomal protein S1
MSASNVPENSSSFNATELPAASEPMESFDSILSEFERSHSRRSGEGGRQISGTVVAVSAEFVFVDI